MTIARIDDVYYNVCDEHQRIFLPGQECSRCAANERDTLNVLEARIADLEARLLSTNRQLAVLQQIAQDLQRAHNALVEHVTTERAP